jgi:hypothetical protein
MGAYAAHRIPLSADIVIRRQFASSKPFSRHGARVCQKFLTKSRTQQTNSEFVRARVINSSRVDAQPKLDRIDLTKR